MKRIRTFFGRQSIVPFEAMFGFFFMYGGVAGLFAFGVTNDIFRKTVGERWALVLNIIYSLAGTGMFFGLGSNRRDIESIGLITVATSLLIRSVVLGFKVGFNPTMLNAHVLTGALIIACLVRSLKLIKGSVLIEVKDGKLQ